jgi:hypothetical protein
VATILVLDWLRMVAKHNEMPCNNNSFTILNIVGRDKLKRVASNYDVKLGGDTNVIDNQINPLLAKEKA